MLATATCRTSRDQAVNSLRLLGNLQMFREEGKGTSFEGSRILRGSAAASCAEGRGKSQWLGKKAQNYLIGAAPAYNLSTPAQRYISRPSGASLLPLSHRFHPVSSPAGMSTLPRIERENSIFTSVATSFNIIRSDRSTWPHALFTTEPS